MKLLFQGFSRRLPTLWQLSNVYETKIAALNITLTLHSATTQHVATTKELYATATELLRRYNERASTQLLRATTSYYTATTQLLRATA